MCIGFPNCALVGNQLYVDDGDIKQALRPGNSPDDIYGIHSRMLPSRLPETSH